jgi:hypothetical protein
MDELTEVQALKNFLGTLFGRSFTKKVATGNVSVSAVETQAREIMGAICKRNDISIRKIERFRRADALVLRYHISIGSTKYMMKCYVVFETRYTTIDLWTEDHYRLLDFLGMGDLRKKYTLRAQAKIRLRPWLKKK